MTKYMEIRATVSELLESHPEGMTSSELFREVSALHPGVIEPTQLTELIYNMCKSRLVVKKRHVKFVTYRYFSAPEEKPAAVLPKVVKTNGVMEWSVRYLLKVAA